MSVSSIPERTRSPAKSRDSPTRPSSRSSVRSGRGSPSVAFDDSVAIRNQVSTLKHSIRHQTAQLHSLETMLHSQPRISSISLNEDQSPTSPVAPRMSKRSSYEVLQGIAGPDSSLPLPRRDTLDDNSIREGIPTSSSAARRASSPTRTLSRIPVSSVGNARALADDGLPMPPPKSPNGTSSKTLPDSDPPPSGSLLPPPSPSRRISMMTPGGTTKVLADLQTGVINARNALENTKAQLRLSQRSVAQLTRQVEDLREGRERLRLENEGLNNVVARKERLLQEVLERARKAEAEVTSLKSQLKTETTTNKKTMREMESSLAESTALSSKSEREYITLRDSIKGLTESWKTDTDRLREDIRRREDKWKTDAEVMGKKYRTLVEDVKQAEAARQSSRQLREEDTHLGKELEQAWSEEVAAMRAAMDKSNKESEEANNTAKYVFCLCPCLVCSRRAFRELATELSRLRRLMRTAGRAEETEAPS
ncbi:hypothetical protein BD626DRAFT_204667 [Schizophyllum amplum]|uniref:SWI5-dependent HO expression protein 3 n=1 Tax=Schizophyllum amplum TaxID=97359 RepID=A0A550BZB6_9AGAR|nr:hypothetical protein BD626DRAFT_204667 [Auriculariopsis ampla]